MANLQGYIITETASILDALKAINDNIKGFLIVNDADNKVVGVITDGDIRRAFIKGATAECSISEYVVRKFTSLIPKNDISDAIEIFKNKAIKFLPIPNAEGELSNIITKG